MNKKLFTLAYLLILTMSFGVYAATPELPTGDKAQPSTQKKPSADTISEEGKSIFKTLNPKTKNCNYVDNKLYQPFADIDKSFPGASNILKMNDDGCIGVASSTESIVKLLFTTGITIIIILTVVMISVSGIQYMTEEAVGKKGEAKKRLTNSIIALGLGLLSYTILYTINKQLVEFSFDPGSIDYKDSIDKGISDTNKAASSTSGYYGDIAGIEAMNQPTNYSQMNNLSYSATSPTGWVNPYTKAPCNPPATFPLSTRIINRFYLLAAVYNPNAYVPTNGAYNPNNPFLVTNNANNPFNPAQPTTNTSGEPCVKESTLMGTFNGVGNTSALTTPQTTIQARITTIGNATLSKAVASGIISVSGVNYNFRSGGGGNGYLPIGTYTVTNGRTRGDVSSMMIDGFGFSFDLSDAFDPRTNAQRELLRIHPDGGGPGTIGCIGIVGDINTQKQFFNSLMSLLSTNGGKYTITVSQ